MKESTGIVIKFEQEQDSDPDDVTDCDFMVTKWEW